MDNALIDGIRQKAAGLLLIILAVLAGYTSGSDGIVCLVFLDFGLFLIMSKRKIIDF